MKKKKLSKELTVGIFTVVILVSGYFGYNFLSSRNVFSGDYTLYVVMDQTQGLESSAGVVLQGFRVGKVDDITFDLKTKKLTAQLTINGEYPLPKSTTATIVSSSLLGGKVLDLTIGSISAPSFQSGDTLSFVETADGMADAMGQIGGIMSSLGDITAKIDSALDGVNQIVGEQNREAISHTMHNLQSATTDLKKITNSQRTNIESTLENLAVISQSLKSIAPELERGVGNIVALSDTLSSSAPMLIANANGSIESLRAILQKVENGEGSVGKLVHDEALYVNLNEALENLAILLADLQANPKKYINVTVFGKREKEEKQ